MLRKISLYRRAFDGPNRGNIAIYDAIQLVGAVYGVNKKEKNVLLPEPHERSIRFMMPHYAKRFSSRQRLSSMYRKIALESLNAD